MKYTKGKWTINDTPTAEEVICIVGSRVKGDEYEANAKLIASAPELLEALKDIKMMCKDTIEKGLEFEPKEVMERINQVL